MLRLRKLLLIAFIMASSHCFAEELSCIAISNGDGTNTCIRSTSLLDRGVDYVKIDPRDQFARAYGRNAEGKFMGLFTGRLILSTNLPGGPKWAVIHSAAIQVGPATSNPLHGVYEPVGITLPMGIKKIDIAGVGDHWRFSVRAKTNCEVLNGDERVAAKVLCDSFGFGPWEQFLNPALPISYKMANQISCKETRGDRLSADAPEMPICDAQALQSSLRDLFPTNGTFNWEHESDDITLSSGARLKLVLIGPNGGL